jgi:hypothetical protein
MIIFKLSISFILNVVEFDLMAIWVTYSIYETKFKIRIVWALVKNRINL